MCLETNECKPKVATKDITCYKVVWQFNNRIITPMVCAPFELDDEGVFKAKGKKIINPPIYGGKNWGGTYDVAEGFVHTFKKISSAESSAGMTSYVCGGRTFVIKCYIPKGTEYYEGICGDATSYASDVIKVEKNKNGEPYLIALYEYGTKKVVRNGVEIEEATINQ